MKGYSLGLSANMQSLVVQVLAMRQLGRLSPRHLLAAGYTLRQTEWCPRTIHTRQLWGCSFSPGHGGHRPAIRGRDAARSWSVQQLRFKSNKKKSPSTAVQEEDEDEEKDDPEDSDYEEVDPNVPKDYKDIEKHVQSFRSDVILKAGLDISRNKIEDAFYSNKLRLNGQQLIKKSKAVKPGDTLDLVLSQNQETNTVTLMRVMLRRVLGESSNAEKYKVSIRRWKNLELAKEEVFKP
ncbi:mitochondrial transcription rescue factor 1 isoform X2 [Cololabis saira]|uniref:mitochondrial transcription rescue factor 1 isoform X2 n=1 Tax=Cololabis saira TaxID=129043 RepID=UPI002AD410B3|nr:mitochondrial transcription rescue factor 1 isoform X2 [Cololabis saira]